MKKSVLLIALCAGLNSLAQQYNHCGTHQAILDYDANHPGYLENVNETFYRAKQTGSQDRSTVYIIPVVVHIVYNTPQENLDDSVIFNQIARLNEDYRRLNEDTTNTRDTFLTIVGDSYIEFQLAMFDPDGNPTTGITRTYTAQNSFFGVGGTPAEGVKSTANGGIDPWDQSRYLNIWVCDMSLFDIPFLLGYATPPADLPHWPAGSTDGMSDGVVIQYQAFGSNNPNELDAGSGPIDVQGRTTVHEVGHYLGLRHIWGDGDCTAEDGIDDTPNAADQSNQDCNFSSNTCTDNIGTLGDLPDMVENYMDYSAETCQNSFTLGQIDMMRAILENYRYDLINGNPALGVENGEIHSFSIYPNPASGNFIIEGLNTESKTITIYSETGSQLQIITTTDQQIVIDALAAGVYFISVLQGEALEMRKVVVL
ncbi:MAG: T9SS type A sorting domain-containing protein [Crocinitomicaceae bacterium]|nr:T9SS type A sorting domain-containing protein [Crocinitomicaceae bacterium]MBK8927194.1 T9SS type A sorting domain-containing protein [Crocinitomicaceae bacterium]